MKLQVFQQIVELNHSFDRLITSLQGLRSVPFFQQDLIRHALSDVEIARVYTNREFFDNFEKIVEDDAKWVYKFQRRFNDKLKDRDNIYLEVRTSEEQRKGKGLLPRVVILPKWDMSDEDRYDEEQTSRRTRAAMKKRRTAEQNRPWKQSQIREPAHEEAKFWHTTNTSQIHSWPPVSGRSGEGRAMG